jgi:hypothetical protein
MSNPKVTAELINGRFQIQVENWVGVPVMALEYLNFDLYKALQVERARLEREANNKQAADAVVTDGNKVVNPPFDDQSLKEFENVLLKS